MKIESCNNSPVQMVGLYKNRNVSFKRNWTEHVSWGANYMSKTGKANFKLFTFPNAQKVFLEVANNLNALAGGIKSRATEVISTLTAATGAVLLAKDNNSKLYEMKNNGEGVFNINDIDVQKDDKYRFVIIDEKGDYKFVKDPYSKQQADINGWSEIYDKDAYKWQNTEWFSTDNAKRIKRNPEDKKFRGLSDIVIEEINIPTLSDKGDFESAKRYIDGIAERGIANAVEIMPLENTFSLQWGYDGVDKFAVNSKMGSNDKFKELVDYIHGKGLNVIIDMVPNHLGADGDCLSQTGPYENGQGPFGAKINFENKDSKYVRDYMVNAALNWVNEYKADGLRLDLVSACESDIFLKQLVKEVNYHNPDVFLIAEDGRGLSSTTKYEKSNPLEIHEESIEAIDNAVEQITNGMGPQRAIHLGFDSKWNFGLMHSLQDNLLIKTDLDCFENEYKNAGHKINYFYSHDEIGNMDGTRFIPKYLATNLKLYNKVCGNNNAEKGQNAAKVSQAINDIYLEKGDYLTEDELNAVACRDGMQTSKHIKLNKFITAYEMAKAKQRLGTGIIFTTPGPKMFFQGDDRLHTEPFKFFREFSSDKELRKSEAYVKSILREKGYDTLESITRKECIIKDDFHNKDIDEMLCYSRDLAQLLKEMPSIRKGDIVGTFKDYGNSIFISHLKYADEEALVIMNFGNNYYKTYSYEGFPPGQWLEVLNSDNLKYGGSDYNNRERIDISFPNQNLSLAPNSMSILKKAG